MKVDVENLVPGMILSRPVYDDNSNILFNEGTVLTQKYIEKLMEWDIPEVHVYDRVDNQNANYTKEATEKTLSESEQDEILIRAKAAIINFQKATEEKIRVIKEVRQKVRESVQLIMEITKNTEKIDYERTKKVVDTFLQDLLSELNILLNLLEIRSMEGYLYTHSINVCGLSLLLANSLGYSEDELRKVGIAALMHDVGMVRIPESIYNKSEALTRDEIDIIRKHPIYSAQILKSSSGFDEEIALVVYQHHERYDGQGYPKGVSGDDIHPYAQIISIADTFESITNPRPFRQKKSAYEAIREIIANSGKQFNPKIVQYFIKQMAVYPIGSFVQLNTGEVAVVYESNKTLPLRPKVKLLFDEGLNELLEKRLVDLSKQPTLFIKRVVDFDEIAEKIKEIDIFGER